MDKTKIGECYYRAEDGSLWIAESFMDANGVVTSEGRLVEAALAEGEEVKGQSNA